MQTCQLSAETEVWWLLIRHSGSHLQSYPLEGEWSRGNHISLSRWLKVNVISHFKITKQTNRIRRHHVPRTSRQRLWGYCPHFCILFHFCSVEASPPYVAWVGLELELFLSLSPKCWDYQSVPLCTPWLFTISSKKDIFRFMTSRNFLITYLFLIW